MTNDDRAAEERSGPPHRIGTALVCLHVSAGIYATLGIASPWLFAWISELDDGPGRRWGIVVGVAVLSLFAVLVAGIELVAHGLRRRRFWAWVAGLCIFGIYVPSLFLPLGVLGLWGLLDAGSQQAFGVGRGRGAGGAG